MKKRNSKERLNLWRYVYLCFAIIFLIGGIAFNLIPDVSNAVKSVAGENGMMLFNVNLAINVILYIWLFLLAKRVVDGKSKGTLFDILLILSAAAGISKLFNAPEMRAWGVFDIVINLITSYLLYKVKYNSDK